MKMQSLELGEAVQELCSRVWSASLKASASPLEEKCRMHQLDTINNMAVLFSCVKEASASRGPGYFVAIFSIVMEALERGAKVLATTSHAVAANHIVTEMRKYRPPPSGPDGFDSDDGPPDPNPGSDSVAEDDKVELAHKSVQHGDAGKLVEAV